MRSFQNQMTTFLLLFFLSTSVQTTTAADPTALKYIGCSQSTYTANSPYQSDVESILTSFANSASTSPFGNFTSSSVSGIFQCRGDLPTSDCQSCIRSALNHLSSTCSSSSGAAVQLDACMIRYGNESFLGKEETNLLYKNCGSVPPNGYDPNLVGMRDSALGTISSSGGTGGTYRVGAAGFVQAAAQCVGDLSSKDCSDCISNAVGQLKTLCGDADSGEVYLGKCFAKFYSNGNGVYTPPTSSGSSQYPYSDIHDSHDDHWQEAGKTIAIVVGLIFGIALLIAFASYLNRAGRNK